MPMPQAYIEHAQTVKVPDISQAIATKLYLHIQPVFPVWHPQTNAHGVLFAHADTCSWA